MQFSHPADCIGMRYGVPGMRAVSISRSLLPWWVPRDPQHQRYFFLDVNDKLRLPEPFLKPLVLLAKLLGLTDKRYMLICLPTSLLWIKCGKSPLVPLAPPVGKG